MRKILAAILIITSLTFFTPTPQVRAATDIVNDATLGANLISCWSFDETSGTRVDSVTGTGNDLADNNTVGSATGIQGNGADFVRANSEYLSLARASITGLSPGTGDISYSFWWKPDDVALNGAIGIFPDVTADNEYVTYMQSGKMKVQIINDATSGNKRVRADTTTLTAGNWYHIVFTIDSSTAGISMWINGTSQTLATENNNGGTFINQGSADFRVGRWQSVLYFNGAMDEMAVWSDLKDATDVSNLYASGSGIPCGTLSAGGDATPPPTFIWFE